jgi:hypothetical protein
MSTPEHRETKGWMEIVAAEPRRQATINRALAVWF